MENQPYIRFDMDSVIREGALRLLAYEGSSDVILSCQGHRMMAHKVILSMASPVFKTLLEDSTSEPTIIIFPDTSSRTMSLILDYIYTGSALIYSDNIRDFLGLAELLRLQLDFEKRSSMLDTTKVEEEVERVGEVEGEEVSSTRDAAPTTTKTNPIIRRLPELLPLRTSRNRSEKRLCSYLLPSPWCPRPEGVYGDPRGVMRSAAPDPNNNEVAGAEVDCLQQQLGRPFGGGVGGGRAAARCGGERSGDVRASDGDKGDGLKPFRCEECGKRFSQLRNYKYHR